MSIATKTELRCERCGEPLASGSSLAGDCLNCQLLDSLTRSGHGAADASLRPVKEMGAARCYQHYELLTREDGSLWELGRGAMGVTYKALDANLRVPVALKIINPRYARSHEARQRFLQEARAAAWLRHPNVASVFHFGTIPRSAANASGGGGKPAQEEECFYAMEFVEGETLEAHLRRTGPLDATQTVEIALQVARALVAAEKRGIIHRDLKPANLMLVAESAGASHGEAWVKVIDFGLAKAVDEAAVGNGINADDGHSDWRNRDGFVGTPQFASPEQFEGRAVDGRADVFSLGVVLWYALTGKLPFEGASLHDIHERQVHRPLPVGELTDAQVPATLVKLLGRLLCPEPGTRPASAAVLHTQLELCRETLQADTGVPAPHDKLSGSRRRATAAGLLTLLSVVVVGGLFLARHQTERVSPPISQTSATDKSVAVLPFENFSTDKDSAIFAEGVQDEVLTNLAKVADLKVISRSSVMTYKDIKARNLREIGQALGVAYVVEGSVQRVGNQIRVAAQLIDTRTGTHKWAEHYDRPLNDVFAIQSDIAQSIAGQLQAVISSREQSSMNEVPTRDLEAYSLYLQARQSFSDMSTPDTTRGFYDRILRLLDAATTRDPSFARAFAYAVYVRSILYRDHETNEAQAAIMRGLVEIVERLRPGSADAHYAAGVYDGVVRREFESAREHVATAARLLPNNADIWFYLAASEFHLGRWSEAQAHFRKSADLEPNSNDDATYKQVVILTYQQRFPEALSILDRRLASRPSTFFRIQKAWLLMNWKGDLAAVRAELASVPVVAGNLDEGTTRIRLVCECRARDYAAAGRALAACPLAEMQADRGGPWGYVPRSYYEGLLARYRGDEAAATGALSSARALLENQRQTQPMNPCVLLSLATVDAALGRPEDALAEGRRALAMRGPQTSAWLGPSCRLAFARVLAWVGERDEAILTLQALSAAPGGPTYGDLKLHPDWDTLRGDPRFEALVVSLASKQ